jgi:hypothetical protein
MERHFFRKTRDGRHVVALNFYPALRAHFLSFLGASENNESISNAVSKWDAVELENAAAEKDWSWPWCGQMRNFAANHNTSDALSQMPLISVEKIGESDPVPLKANGDNLPLAGIRAVGMGHVIAGAAIGRDYGFVWRRRT